MEPSCPGNPTTVMASGYQFDMEQRETSAGSTPTSLSPTLINCSETTIGPVTNVYHVENQITIQAPPSAVQSGEINHESACESDPCHSVGRIMGTTDDTDLRSFSDLFQSHCRKRSKSIVSTSLYKKAKKMIESNPSLLLIGGSGDGKSSILQKLSAESAPKYLPIKCSGPKDIDTYARLARRTNTSLLFVFDEPFGTSYIQQLLLDAWVHMAGILDIHLNDHKFLFATRKSVWIDCEVHLSESPFFCNVINVASSYLTKEDKIDMLKQHDKPGILGKKEIEDILHIDRPIAFAQCCRLMGEAIDNALPPESLVEIFEKPYSFLRSELRKMKDREKGKYAILCLIMLSGGRIKYKDLTLSGTTVEVQDKVRLVLDACRCSGLTSGDLLDYAIKLTGTYLDKVSGMGEDLKRYQFYKFSHDSVYESVVMEYGARHGGDIWKFLSDDLSIRIARPFNYTPLNEQEFVVNIAVEYYTEIVTLFTDKAIRGNQHLDAVFKNPCVRDDEFQSEWCEYLASSPDKLSALSRSLPWHGIWCVVYFAAEAGADKLLKFLLDHKVRCTCPGTNRPLCGAARGDRTEIARYLLASFNLDNNEVYNAMALACELGSLNVLRYLLTESKQKLSSDIIQEGLELAGRGGRPKVVEYLLENHCTPCKGPDWCACGSGLRGAAGGGYTEIVRLLLFHGADINSKNTHGETCLHEAAIEGHGAVVEDILTRGADIQAINSEGYTCIHLAVLNGMTDVVRVLVSHGADLNSTDTRGNTNLHLAIRHYRGDTVNYLLSHCSDLNAKDTYGITPLHLAADRHNPALVSVLLNKGADVNSVDRWGLTPLHVVLADTRLDGGQVEVLELLLEGGASVHIEDNWHESVLDLAKRCNHSAAILEVLSKYGHDVEAHRVGQRSHRSSQDIEQMDIAYNSSN